MCRYCPRYETTLESRASECVCQSGMFQDSDWKCRYCPDVGSDCQEMGLTLASVTVLPGFFRAHNDSLQLYPCVARHRVNATYHMDCVGGNLSHQCQRHHTGPLCMVCEMGFTRHGAGVQPCQRCQVDDGMQAFAYLGVLLLFGLFSTGFVYGAFRYFSREVSATSTANSSGNKELTFLKESIQTMSKIKILVGWGQVASSVGTTFSAPWPTGFLQLIGGLSSLFNLDVFGFLSGFGCLFDSSFGLNFVMHMLTLPYLLGLLALAAWLTQRRTAIIREILVNRVIYVVSVVTFFMYPGLGVRIFSVFKCRTVEERSYLMADFSQPCYEGGHLAMAVFAVLFLILYVIGIPTVTYRRLVKHKGTIVHRLEQPVDPSVQARYGHLYAPYKPAYWYNELVEMGRKVILTAGLSMLTSKSAAQLLIGILVCFAHHTYLAACNPFLNRTDTWLSQGAGIQIFLTLLLGMTLQMEVEVDKQAIAVTLVLMVVVILVIGLVMIGLIVCKAENIRQLQAQSAVVKKAVEQRVRSVKNPMVASVKNPIVALTVRQPATKTTI